MSKDFLSQFDVFPPRPKDNRNGLVGWWPFVDGSFKDFSGHQLDGQGQGSPTTPVLHGSNGMNALSLNGSNQNVHILNSAAGPLDITVFTIMAWIFPTTVSTLQGIISKYNTTGGHEYTLRLNNAKLEYGAVTNNDSTASLTINTWYHVAASSTAGGSVTLLINGAVDSTGANSTVSSTDDVTIGQDFTSGGGRYFQGMIADVRIYNRVLSPSEVFGIYASQKVFRPQVTETDLPMMSANVASLSSKARESRRGYGALSKLNAFATKSKGARRGFGTLHVPPHNSLSGIGRTGRRTIVGGTPRTKLAVTGKGRSQRRTIAGLGPTPIVPAAPASLPTLKGLGWSFHKKPRYNTIVAASPSGADVRTALWTNPVYEYEATFDGLGGDAVNYPGIGANSFQTLMGFVLELGGMWGSFLFVDPDDSSVTGEQLGLGDGVTQDFAFTRTFGNFVEPVGWVTTLTTCYLGLVPQVSGFSVITPNTLRFATAPLANVSVVADFSYAFLCRMDDDALDFEEFMNKLHTVKSFKFRSLRLS